MTYFLEMKFLINKKVFIPRPETEELVHWIIKNHFNNKNKMQVFDLCTGSGCIGISLKKKLSNIIENVYAIDFSNESIKIARKNAVLNNVKINFMITDIIKNIDSIPNSIINNNFTNLIVSNPPYIKTSNKKNLHYNIICYEPHDSIFVSDKNPIIFYKNISSWIIKKFNGIVYLYFEIDSIYNNIITKNLKSLGFFNIKTKKDFQGIYRMIYAEYHSG